MARDISFSLISQTKQKDSTGQMKPTGEPTVKKCVGTQKSVSQNEFFKASQAGFRPEGVIEMNIADYAGETVIQIGSNKFTIYRTYYPESDFVELYFGDRVGI
ncbi:MAG: hypothetical protein IKH20_11915 [Clostridiales bacterium]|nr:hypothetical protein [Clostridiales bacterium]